MSCINLRYLYIHLSLDPPNIPYIICLAQNLLQGHSQSGHIFTQLESNNRQPEIKLNKSQILIFWLVFIQINRVIKADWLFFVSLFSIKSCEDRVQSQNKFIISISPSIGYRSFWGRCPSHHFITRPIHGHSLLLFSGTAIQVACGWAGAVIEKNTHAFDNRKMKG